MAMKPPSDSMPAMISVVVVSSTSRSVELVAVDLGQREMRDQVVARIGLALGDDLAGVVLHPLIGGDVLGAFLARLGIGLHHEHGLVAHEVVVALGQA